MAWRSRSVRASEYEFLLRLDGSIFPVAQSPRLNEWYSKLPEFGLIFEDGQENSGEPEKDIAGVLLIVPMKATSWRAFCLGDLAEEEIGEQDIFDRELDSEIGLHVYHLEKRKNIPSFTRLAFATLTKILDWLQEQLCSFSSPRQLKVIGFSALVCSPSGIQIFQNSLNFVEPANFRDLLTLPANTLPLTRTTSRTEARHLFSRKAGGKETLKLIEGHVSGEKAEELRKESWNYYLRCRTVFTVLPTSNISRQDDRLFSPVWAFVPPLSKQTFG